MDGADAIENLRDVSHHENCLNRSTGEHPGVTYAPSVNKWRARLYRKGINYELGNYYSKDLAIEARGFAEEIYHG